MPKEPTEAIRRRVEALLAKAADDGASEEERRTSAVIAARLMREHGIGVSMGGAAASPPPSPAPEVPPIYRARIETVVNGARTVVEAISSGVGFDVGAFVQGLARERVQSALTGAFAFSPPSAKRKKRRSQGRRRSGG